MPGRGMDPRMLAALITAMPEEQRAALAGQMGVTVDQLGQVAQMMASGMIPMGEDGDEEGEGGAEGVPPGATVVRLTEAEAAAVERVCGQHRAVFALCVMYCVCSRVRRFRCCCCYRVCAVGVTRVHT